jgi:ferredoxin--NADP+ reductase
MSDAVKHLADYDTQRRYQATLISSERITPGGSEEEVRELLLELEQPETPPRVGHSIGVLAPGAREFGQEHHFRLYTVADQPEPAGSGKTRCRIAVRRCSYIDEFSGERYDGVASNFLCDLQPGDRLLVTGPYELPFGVPEEMDANLVLIGSGTGIAPFRAFVKHLYRDVPAWKGRVWLFHGARSGLEMLYMNDEKDDFAQYYDEETFQAFKALSPRPGWNEPIAWASAIEERGQELWEMLGNPKTYVYVAGLEKMLEELDKVFANLAGSKEKWERRKAELKAGERWIELVY